MYVPRPCLFCTLFFILSDGCTNQLRCLRQLRFGMRCHEGNAQARSTLCYRRIADSGGEHAVCQQLICNLQSGLLIANDNRNDGGGRVGFYAFSVQCV